MELNTDFLNIIKEKVDNTIKNIIDERISLTDDFLNRKLKERTEYLIDNNCSVCYEVTNKKTKCNHLLCDDCNNSLINRICPICRKNI